MFERFTERARQVVVFAQDEARALQHNYIGTEHLLLGLLREEDGIAAHVLDELDVTLEEVRAQVARIVGAGDEAAGGQVPFTPRAKRVLELALREALSLGHNYIGSEHLLLGLVRENEGVAARILLDFGSDAERVRNAVVGQLTQTRGAHAEKSPYEPKAPPLASEVVEEIARLRAERKAAREANDREREREARRRLRQLTWAGERLEAAWEGRYDPEPPRREYVRAPSASADVREVVRSPLWWQTAALVGFGAAIALGAVVVGWLVAG